MKIHGVRHEFSTIDGVYEDVPDIILNVKQLLVRMHRDGAVKLWLKAKKKGPVTAADITGDESIEIVNKDLHIATLTKNTIQPAGDLPAFDRLTTPTRLQRRAFDLLGVPIAT